MFKFPLKRHHNHSSNHHSNTKSATSLSNEGFIFIRCGHNHLNSANSNNSNNNIGNSIITENSYNNNSSNGSKISSNNSANITDISNADSSPYPNKKYIAKSTVQSSWRPQLPLPKELQLSNENISELQQHPQEPSHPYQQLQLQQQQHQQKQNNFYPHQQQQYDVNDLDEIQIIESDMDRFHMSSKKDPSLNGSQLSNASHNNNSNSKKWSFGRFFRRNKKEIESESSSEDDRKAGFSPAHKYPRSSSAATSTPNKKSKSKAAANSSAANRNSRAGGFDHIVISPISGNSSSTVTSPVIGHIDNEFFLPVETVSPMGSQEPFYQNQTQRLHHSQQYLSHAPQTQQQLLSKSAHSLDRRASRAKQRSAAKAAGHSPQVVPGSSSEEELISLNSSTFSKYRSDESIHSGGQGHNGSGMSRKSRAARNERYYKRLSRDGEVSHGQVPVMLAQQPTQRWKTQPVPLSIYQPPSTARQHPEPQLRSSVDNASISKLRNTSSLQHMAPYVQWNPQQLQQRAQQQQPSKNLQNSVNEAKRSISYDSHIHLQNINGRMQTKPLPPPPPPRDPLRRVNVGSGHLQEGSSSDLRPISYAFDQTGVPVLPASGLSGRCVSDDKIWAQHQPQYQSIRSLNISANQGNQSGVQPQNRRFITRADRDAHPGKKSLPNGLDFHYVADATPRSRKPIHMLEAGNKTAPYGDEGEEQPPSSGILRTTKSGLPTSPTKVNATEFWKRMDGSSQNLVTPTPAPRGRDVQRSSVDSTAGINMKPRSVSSSRLSEMRAYPMPMYSEVYKPNKTKTSPQPRAASPHPHQGQDEVDGVVCGSLRIKPAQDNSSSNYVEIRNKDMPKSHSMPDHYHRRSGELSVAPNKYEEYVNERREQHQNAPQPPQRKLVGVPNIPQLSFPRKKPANLEEAINELEAIYRSLGLTEPEATETVPGPIMKKDRVPTPNDFEKYALAHADEYDDDDDSPTGEPDPIRDDVAYRNIKLANLQHKTVEKQPPFGIPIGPIVPASQTDYLHVKPNNQVEFVKKDTKAPDVIKDDLAVRALRKDPLQPKERFQYPSSVLPKKNRATRTQSANIYALIQRDAAKPSGGDLYSYMELTKSIDRSGSMSDLHKKGQEADDVPSTLKLLQSLKEQEKEQNTVAVCSKKAHIPFRHPSQGGAICQLPQKLSTGAEEKKTLVVQHQKPTPMPRKSLTPEPQQGETNKMEEALNKIAQDAQESSIKLSQELQELRKEALITQSKPKRQDSHDDKFEQDLQEIEKVSQAAKKCGKLLLETLPDSDEVAPNEKAPRKLHKEDKLIQAIDQVSEAANKVCEKILKDIVTTEPPVVVQEAVQVKQTQQQQPPSPAVNPSKKDTTSSLVIPTLIKKLDPIQSDKIEAIARRCMRQLSDLADNHDYDNLNQPEISVASTCNLEASNSNKVQSPNDLSTSTLTETPKAFVASKPQEPMIEDIDQIMRECEDQARKQEMAKTTSTTTASATTRAASSSHGPLTKVPPPPAGCSATASSMSSSSDCLAKSSSPTASRRFSSSITSFNPYSSSDYIKSPSSEYHAPSTDRIKSCSTTSYDVQSTTSATPNITTTNSVASNFSCSPSPPPLNLTPVSNCSATLACSSSQRARSSSPSQYNSSEELAMIFGIEDKSGANRMPRTSKLQKHSESAIDSSVNDLSSESATAKTSCQLQQQNPQPLQLQHPQSEQQQQSLLKKQQNFKRYQGHHPHFHHHTAPAYYTDLHLRIHTPEVKDSLNENYQSVYRTPSKLVKDERQFPKTATAVVPPAIIQTPRSPTPKSPREVTSTEQQEGNSTTSTASFFRGAGSGLPREEQQPRSANDPYGSSSPSLANPAKGNSPHDHLPPAVANADGSVVFACTNFKPCKATDFAPQPSGSPRHSPAAGGRSSRNPQRFSNRRRAVRVRSESRPISALYDIICKEKGLDIGSSTSNDEDFSAPNSHDERTATRSRRSHSRSLSKQTKAASSCNVMMSPGGEASQSRGGMVGQKKRQSKDKRSSSSIFINDLSDNEDDDGSLMHHAEDGEHSALHHHQHHQKRHLLMGDAQMKSSSLPPGLKSLSDYSLNIENHNNKNNHHQHPHQHPSSKVSQDSLKTLQTSSASDNVLNANYSSLSSSAKPIPPSVAGAGAGTSTAAAATMVASPKAERSSRKYRRSRDEKPRRHTDGAVHIMAAEQMDDQQEQPQQYPHHSHHHHPQSLPPAPMSLQCDDHDDADHTHRHHHHQHRHHHKHQHHHQPEQFPASELQHSHHHHQQQHDLNGAGHDFHVSANAANAKRFITRSQRATSAGIINGGGGGGGQPCDSSTSACNSPIQSGRLSPTVSSSIAPTTRASPSSSLQQQQQQPDIPPHLSKSPTAAVHLGKTENGFAAAIGGVNDDMTNNSGRGVSVKPPPVTKTPGVAEDNNSINTTAATTTTPTTTKIKKKSNALDLMNSQIPLSDENKASKTKAEATPPATTGSVSNSNPSNQTGLNTVAVVATTPAVISDKKKGEVNHQNHQHQPQPQHFTSPTSPNKQRSSISADKATPSGSEGEQNGRQMPNSCSPTNRSKKLVPSMSVSSVKQNLNEMHCTAATKATSPRSVNTNSPKSPKNKISNSATTSVECTVKVPSSPKSSPKQSAMNRQSAPPNLQVDDIDDDFMEIHDLPMDDGPMLRPRCSTMQNEAKEKRRSGSNNEAPPELSPVHRSRNSDRSPRRPEERDKSSKRKSNLNRSQNEEPIQDSDEAAARRRKRRELGMARTLVPADDAGAAVKELLTSPSKAQPSSPPKPSSRNDLSYHMELARRGLDQASNANAMANRRRAQTASPKHVKESSSPPSGSSNSKAAGPVLQKVSRRCDTVAIGELRKQRTDEVNRKLNERTRSDLAEIIKIAEIANDCSESAANAISDLTKTMNRLRTSQEIDAATEEANRCSPGKHTTFHQEERIYYEPDPLEHIDQNGFEVQERSKLGGILRSQRMLKARSIERESSFEPPKLSPILRRKSTDDPLSNAPQQSGNQIVSILKKKDHLSACESSSASSNASPVTFSANVMDTPSKQKRAGILKKRSSLDESRYYSRSHSPDERSIFIKSARRNSLEETAANGNMSGNCSLTQGPHGILKQSSYDSFKSDSCPSAGGAVGGGSSGESQHPHSILKKKDSTSTPSDLAQHATKHVSISQAVILAAAELSANETAENVTFGDDVSFTPSNEEYDIKPILKLETSTTDDSVRQPKPILKKKSSGDSDEHEIKPILKTSRKSSREEFEFDPFSESDSASHGEPLVKPILKTDSPSKRRSLGPTDDDADAERESAASPFMLKRRTRSLERQDHTPVIDLGAALNAIATSQENTDDLVASLTSSTPGANVSVADRIKSMEKFLTNQNAATAGSNSAINTSWESPLQNDPNKLEDVATAGGMAAAGAGAVKILKPSVIRRDLLKDRYKTQPVTSDEKNFFKSNDSSTLYTSPAGSAFKPAKSLEGLGFINITAHGNQSPNAPPSAFALTRSYTQPLQPLKHSLSNAAVVTSTSTPPPTASQASTSFKARKTPTRNDSTTNQSDLTHSFTGDSGLSCDSNSEQRIFEMSGLEQDVDMIENQEPKTPSNTADVSSGGSSSGSGIVRTNSVRARANMFQQLQEKTNNGSNNGLNREERTSPRRVPRRLSPSPAANADEPRTPNNPPLNPDEEIEPSSLPVSERLRFFSSLSESHNRNSGSYTRSPPLGCIERSSSLSSYGGYFMPTTPRSSTSQSSASVTPTPMECGGSSSQQQQQHQQWPVTLAESPTILKRDLAATTSQTDGQCQSYQLQKNATIHDFSDSREVIKADIVKTSPFLQATNRVSATPAHLANADTTPTSTLTPTMKRIKLKTIGKLMLPTTFLNNDRNNNHTKENNGSSSAGSSTTTSLSEQNSVDSNDSSSQQPPKKIGKIKSPFIENCNQMQQNKVQLGSKCMKFDYRNHQGGNSTALSSVENSNDHHHHSNNVVSKYFNNSANGLSNGHHHQQEDSNTDSGKENIDTSSSAGGCMLTDSSSSATTCKTTPIGEIRRKFTRKANSSNTQSLNTSGPAGTRTQLTPKSASFTGPHSSSPQIDSKYAKYFGMSSSSSKTPTSTNGTAPPALPKQPPPQSNQLNNKSADANGPSIEIRFSSPPAATNEAINHHVNLWQSRSAGSSRRLKRSLTSNLAELKQFEEIVVTERELKQAAKEFDNLLCGESVLQQPTMVVELEKIFSSIV